ncbi:hypothetical protein [Sphingomonas montana]|uniref:hypothetical protein n=1 Tax=Sphingomonas montana TaxID=1843236 RepID=UPI00101AE6BE|nr:hypothetical protein [Sphingomonas montana]
MIVASDEMVITFVGESVKVKGEMRTARVNLHLLKPDKYGASSYAIDAEVDCTRKLLREVASVGARPDGGVVHLPREAGDNDFKPVRKDSFAVVIQEHLCGIKREDYGKGGIYLYTLGDIAARSVFALLALGIENEASGQLASKRYSEPDEITKALDEQKVPAGKRAAVIHAMDAQIEPEAKPPPPIIPLASAVASGRVGKYMHSEMELASGLCLKADGTFQYFLTVGSLDERASGRWTTQGNRIALINDPVPVPPTITTGPAARERATKLKLKVTTPSRRGVPGVDLVVGFDTGNPTEAYTQGDGWTLPADEKCEPRWVMFSMPSYGLRSARFPISAHRKRIDVHPHTERHRLDQLRQGWCDGGG